MLFRSRPDWVVSRQRYWGTPMAFFVHKETGALHPRSSELLEEVAKRIEEHGIEAWFALDKSELLGAEADQYEKLSDTMDVWFDSGSTHYAVLRQRSELSWPADLYLEGSDQHRGWFQSSLLTACATVGKPPYKQLLTHGFVVDGNGQKMSKSIGNVIAPQKINDSLGADILRLWVASTDYSGELAISDEILKRVTESYRRLRNTLRFLLANLSDFDFEKDAVDTDDMLELDKYALVLAQQLQQRVASDYYGRYAFHFAVQDIVQFCSEDMGAFYLDILKDRLYTMQAGSLGRRSAQTALYHIARNLVLLLSPILCFTAEEAWTVLTGNKEDSVLFQTMHVFPELAEAEITALTQKWQAIRTVRDVVNAAIEPLRADKSIGSSLQVDTIITVPSDLMPYVTALGDELRFVLMVAHVTVQEGAELTATVSADEGQKCERCWHYTDDIGIDSQHPTICGRCATNLDGKGEQRLFA